MIVYLPGGRNADLPAAGSTVTEILKQLGFSRNEVIVSLNGAIVPEDTCVTEEDEMTIYMVAHGG